MYTPVDTLITIVELISEWDDTQPDAQPTEAQPTPSDAPQNKKQPEHVA